MRCFVLFQVSVHVLISFSLHLLFCVFKLGNGLFTHDSLPVNRGKSQHGSCLILTSFSTRTFVFLLSIVIHSIFQNKMKKNKF